MPKVPNRRHSLHLNEEDEKRTVVQAVDDCGLNGEQFADFIKGSVTSQRRRNRGDRKIRWIFYCNWAHSMKEAEIGTEDANYAWPKEVLNYLRSVAPFDVKGEIKKMPTQFPWCSFVRLSAGKMTQWKLDQIRHTK